MTTYVFDPAWQRERDRLSALESLFDAATRRLLTDIGVGPGWRCLEVGAGAGGVARWLAGWVGATGRVLATDVDTRFIDGDGAGNLDVLTHDVATDPLAEAGFDLVHARAVLEHLPGRDEVLARLVSAVRPGGALLIEDVDFGPPTAAALARYVHPRQLAAAAERIFLAVAAVFGAVGADASYGSRLPAALAGAGLSGVRAEVHAPLATGGTENWTRGTVQQLADHLVATGLTSREDIEEFLAASARPDACYLPPLMVSAWGRRP